MMVSANIGCDKGVGGGCGYDENDDDNKDWPLWDENYHNFYILFRSSSGYKPY
jgi:hypothetical protein